jgi:quercetin dioxygenase-like cupin family protein
MKRTFVIPLVLIGAFLIAAPAATGGQMMEGHKIVAPDAVEWGPAPAALPAGAEVAVLYGDPGKDGQFAMRVKLPQGYSVPPHSHPKPEAVTVISGVFKLGLGETADAAKAQPLAAGSFAVLEPGTAHFVSVDEETVIQINSVGPWGIVYIDPADDPRTTQ